LWNGGDRAEMESNEGWGQLWQAASNLTRKCHKLAAESPCQCRRDRHPSPSCPGPYLARVSHSPPKSSGLKCVALLHGLALCLPSLVLMPQTARGRSPCSARRSQPRLSIVWSPCSFSRSVSPVITHRTLHASNRMGVVTGCRYI
jgi:hypothetical protein